MNYRAILSLVRDLIAITDKEVHPHHDGCQAFRINDKEIVIQGHEHVKKFKETVETIWKDDAEIYQTISYKRLTQEIYMILIESSYDGVNVTEHRIEILRETLMSQPLTEWEMFRFLFGTCFMKSAIPPLVYGPFTFYDIEQERSGHITIIEEKYPHAHISDYLKSSERKAHVLVSTKITARDIERAVELADVRFSQLENVMRYMYAIRSRDFHVGISEDCRWLCPRAIALSESATAKIPEREGASRYIYIDEPFYNDESNGHDAIWILLQKPNPHEIERRILNAVEWIGKGINDIDDADAFVQYMFAIESLLQFKEQGSTVTPSVMSQIAEFAAFIIADTYEQRIMIEHLTKKLYGKRSAIAHGGDVKVKAEDLHEALWLSKLLAVRMTVREDLRQMSSMKELRQWVLRKKYE